VKRYSSDGKELISNSVAESRQMIAEETLLVGRDEREVGIDQIRSK